MNALEMLDNGQIFVTYYDGEPDLWNTKPPLMIWLITLCMALLGTDTLALRLPSAIAGMATVILVLWFCIHHLKTFEGGLFSALILITSKGYIGEHVTRTGDYDALLVLWVTIYSLSLFIHFNHLGQKSRQPIYLWVAGVAFILAIWTKGIAGAIVLPGICLYLLIQLKLITSVIRNPYSYYVAATCILFSFLIYFLRESQNPGYIQAVIGNEITGRYGDAIEQHAAENTFYLKGLHDKYKPWVYLWFPCSVLTIVSKRDLFRAYGLFSFLYLVSFTSIISFAKTKLPWYDAPIYPIASITIGLGLYELYNALLHLWNHQLNLKLSSNTAVSFLLSL